MAAYYPIDIIGFWFGGLMMAVYYPIDAICIWVSFGSILSKDIVGFGFGVGVGSNTLPNRRHMYLG